MSGFLRLHHQAIIDRLGMDAALSGAVFKAAAAGNPDRYVVTFLSGRFLADRYSLLPRTADFTLTTHSVGLDDEQAQLVSEHVHAQLHGYQLAVAGWSPRTISHTRFGDAALDDAVLPGRSWVADQYSFISESI